MVPTVPNLRFWPQVLMAVVIAPLNFGVWMLGDGEEALRPVFYLLCVVQLVLAVWGLVNGIRQAGRKASNDTQRLSGVLGAVLGILAAIGAPVGFALGFLAYNFTGGGAWGRPLRVRGRQLHPELREGADWTHGDRPSTNGLNEATCRALEALWLHDAQKEHASVPAFSRISWLLAAVGAPASLLTWSHRAAMEEIDHAQKCFALAAGYGGRSFTVEPMPDLLLGGLNDVKDPLVTLAVESLKDGCLLEDFNADVAAKCAAVCEEPVTKKVLEQIAREERSHADFSWALIDWLLEKHGERVRAPLERAMDELENVARPTSANHEKQQLVDAADHLALRRHGRLTDAEWSAAWTARVVATRERARASSVRVAA
ncbi:MAG: hypothetical protein ACO1OB_32665 [Archangium sp.]